MSNRDNLNHIISFMGARLTELERRIEEQEKSNIDARLDRLENIIYLRHIHSFGDFLRLRFSEFSKTLGKIIGGVNLEDRHFEARSSRLKHIYSQSIVTTRGFSKGKEKPVNRTIYIDITQTVSTDKITGISRVSKELDLAALELGAVPVFQWGRRYIAFTPNSGEFHKIKIKEGDVLLLADASWLSEDLEDLIQSVRDKGGKIVFMLYDIIPIRHPHFCHPHHNRLFTKWLTEIVFKADCIISISEYVSKDTVKYMDEIEFPVESRPAMRWSHLGVDLVASNDIEFSSKSVFNFTSSPAYLSVGAIEPKKNYSIILDAVEKAWNEGADFTYIIVGSYGWGQTQLKNRILEHDEYGNRLQWLQTITDSELVYFYSNCHYLIQGSLAEGFGLPVVEAARFGLTSICSDIPVLKEITRGTGLYFSPKNINHLAKILKDTSRQEKLFCQLQPDTWDISARRTIRLLNQL
jgi:glycosyltransferase involved in cell wall biosynthesis